jgi:hypothetical protein
MERARGAGVGQRAGASGKGNLEIKEPQREGMGTLVLRLSALAGVYPHQIYSVRSGASSVRCRRVHRGCCRPDGHRRRRRRRRRHRRRAFLLLH